MNLGRPIYKFAYYNLVLLLSPKFNKHCFVMSHKLLLIINNTLAWKEELLKLWAARLDSLSWPILEVEFIEFF